MPRERLEAQDTADRTAEKLEGDLATRQAALTRILSMLGDPTSDPPAVLEAIVESAAQLCDADFGTIYLQDGDYFRIAAATGQGLEAIKAYELEHPDHPGRHSITGRVLMTGNPQQIVDIMADPEYDMPVAQELVEFRSLLGLPIMREGRLAGVFNLGRADVRPFSDDAIALLTTFAEQVAVAIGIARLLATVERQRTELARFVSPQIAELISSAEGDALLAGHRRQVTAVFADLRGFTTFSETAEPEELLGVLREYHSAMGELIIEHGGTLEHFAGDGMLVWFNDPIVQDDHAGRAVRMAIAMQARFVELAHGWRKLGHELGLGIGISTGYATLGRIGFEGRYDYAAIGTAVIVAQRLSSQAAAGEILLGQRTYAVVETAIEVEPAGDLELKGFSRPMPAYRVLGWRGVVPA